jgi:hypothetical protein
MNKVSEIVSKYADRLKAFGIQLSAEGEITKEAQMAMAILADGTEVYSPDAEFAVGSELFIMDGDGNPVPAPDGEHTTAEGKMIVVAGGVITEIKEPMEEEPKVEVTIEEEKQAAFEGVSKEEFESTINSEKETLSSTIEKMSKQPAVDSVKKSKAIVEEKQMSKSEFFKMSQTDRVKYLMNNQK